VSISNISSKTYYLSGYNYRFVVADSEFFRLQIPLDPGIKIVSDEETLISLPVKITYDLLFEETGRMITEDSLKCFLMGSFHFSDGTREKGRIPVAFSGEFPIFKELETDALPVMVNDLTIGGADLLFRMAFRNKNEKDLTIVNMRYEIRVAGRELSQGVIQDSILVSGKQEETLEIPVLVSFFDVGKDLYRYLKQDSAPVHILINLEIVTPWNRFSLPLELNKELPLEKVIKNIEERPALFFPL
jgi:LEA14-like dessication related protein